MVRIRTFSAATAMVVACGSVVAAGPEVGSAEFYPSSDRPIGWVKGHPARSAQPAGALHKAVDERLIEKQVILVDEHLGAIVTRNLVQAVDLTHCVTVREQAVLLVHLERLVQDAQFPCSFVERKDMSVVANGNALHSPV